MSHQDTGGTTTGKLWEVDSSVGCVKHKPILNPLFSSTKQRLLTPLPARGRLLAAMDEPPHALCVLLAV